MKQVGVYILSLSVFGAGCIGDVKPPYGNSGDSTILVTTAATGDMSAQYTVAISEYIKAAYRGGITLTDTLFIGKNPDMPDVNLPAVIANVPVILVTSETAKQTLGYRDSLTYLNIIGWPGKEQSEFLIVRFESFKPQHNCTILLKPSADTFLLDSLYFDYPYGKLNMQR